jgi:hypothetical protein
LSMNDLQARLDRAADELTWAAIPPPAVAIRRRGQRRQQRLVAAAVVVVALVAALWGPGAGLFNRVPPAPSAAPGPATATLGLTPPPVGPGQIAVVIQPPTYGLPERLLVQDIQCYTYPHLGPGVSIYSEATIKGEMRPVELVARLPGRTSTGPADFFAAVEVQPSEGNQPSQHLTIQNRTGRSELQAADGSRGWAVGPHRLTDHNGKTIQPPGAALAAFAWWCKDITQENPSTTTP